MKPTAESSSRTIPLPDYFYDIKLSLEDRTLRWFMEELDQIDAELAEKFRSPGARIQLALKRLVDIVGSSVLIILLAPVLIIAALAVRLTSRGPTMHRAKRWGRQEKHFTCLKFRSMYVDQHKIVDQSQVDKIHNSGVLVKLERDPRITPVGVFLRRTSIDELPQLFNVLKGDMSLVGPRPLVLYMLEPYPELRRVRCMVRPGITGLWQIRDRENNTSALCMLTHDVEYLRKFCLGLDLKILLVTPLEVLFGKGAI